MKSIGLFDMGGFQINFWVVGWFGWRLLLPQVLLGAGHWQQNEEEAW